MNVLATSYYNNLRARDRMSRDELVNVFLFIINEVKVDYSFW